MSAPKPARNPWTWIPTLYLAEGLPYALVMTVSVVLYKDLGISNEQIAFYTSLLGLPWVIKPLWSPLVSLLKTRRLWIWPMELIVGIGLAGAALCIPLPSFLTWTLLLFTLIAFCAATHDIAGDGLYLLALSEKDQALLSGVRNTFFRIALICGQGPLVILAGKLQKSNGNTATAWMTTYGVAAAVLIVLGLYHRFSLPQSARDVPPTREAVETFGNQFVETFVSFFKKPQIILLLSFILLYRLGEAQLVKMVVPFLRDPREKGGLGLTTDDVGFIYGTIGVIALLCGGLVGGFVVSRQGLKRWLWPMLFAIHLPDAVFIYLAHAQPTSLHTIGICVAVEQFGYGFGFSAFMLYMIYIARGEHATAHYAICTGFMALGMMLPGMWSGWLQEHIGYPHFFEWVMLATIPSFLVTLFIPLDAEFGRKTT